MSDLNVRPQTVPAPSGKPAPSDRALFGTPPPELGEVVTADSDMAPNGRSINDTPGGQSAERGAKMILRGVGFGILGYVVVAVGFAILKNAAGLDSLPSSALLGLVGLVVGAGLGVLSGSKAKLVFPCTCNYVCANGLATANVPDVDQPDKLEVKAAPFAGAHAMHIIQDHMQHGGYRGSVDVLELIDPAGQPLLRFDVAYDKRKPLTEHYFLVRHAAARFAATRGEELAARVQAGETVTFPVYEWPATPGGQYKEQPKYSVVVSPGRLALTTLLTGGTVTLAPEDVKRMFFERGALRLEEPDAKQGFFTDKGIHRIPMERVADSLALLQVLKAAGFPVDLG